MCSTFTPRPCQGSSPAYAIVSTIALIIYSYIKTIITEIQNINMITRPTPIKYMNADKACHIPPKSHKAGAKINFSTPNILAYSFSVQEYSFYEELFHNISLYNFSMNKRIKSHLFTDCFLNTYFISCK